ncbi:hypothetical protein GCM10010252_23320 [Streptomyces aureoverticillatus]|nr:hypothetical protein GCM10010252_23320 [Streptomyces aureoverticillatus]
MSEDSEPHAVSRPRGSKAAVATAAMRRRELMVERVMGRLPELSAAACVGRLESASRPVPATTKSGQNGKLGRTFPADQVKRSTGGTLERDAHGGSP